MKTPNFFGNGQIVPSDLLIGEKFDDFSKVV
jgi:hypothetical protein